MKSQNDSKISKGESFVSTDRPFMAPRNSTQHQNENELELNELLKVEDFSFKNQGLKNNESQGKVSSLLMRNTTSYLGGTTINEISPTSKLLLSDQ